MIHCLALSSCAWLIADGKNFVLELATVPNLKVDYVIINAGVLRYPNVSSPRTTRNTAIVH